MKIYEATHILRKSGYYCYRNSLSRPNYLTEGKVTDILKKIPDILSSFKNRIQAGEGAEVKEDLEDLKDEIKAKRVLDSFGNATALKKAIFGTISCLMLMSSIGCTDVSDDGYQNASATKKISASHNVDAEFDKMENAIKAACGDAESCNVTIIDHKVTGGTGDGENTFSWKLVKQQPAKNGGQFYKLAVDQDNNGKADMGVILHTTADGQIEHVKWLNNDNDDGEWEAANNKISKIFPNVDKLIQNYR